MNPLASSCACMTLLSGLDQDIVQGYPVQGDLHASSCPCEYRRFTSEAESDGSLTCSNAERPVTCGPSVSCPAFLIFPWAA